MIQVAASTRRKDRRRQERPQDIDVCPSMQIFSYTFIITLERNSLQFLLFGQSSTVPIDNIRDFSKLSFKMGGWGGKYTVIHFRQVNCILLRYLDEAACGGKQSTRLEPQRCLLIAGRPREDHWAPIASYKMWWWWLLLAIKVQYLTFLISSSLFISFFNWDILDIQHCIHFFFYFRHGLKINT